MDCNILTSDYTTVAQTDYKGVGLVDENFVKPSYDNARSFGKC